MGSQGSLQSPTVFVFYRLLLIALILLALTLRLYKLDAQSLWYDEGVTATVAEYNLPKLTQWTANDIQPPLYYYVVALWAPWASWDELTLRFPSVFFGVLTIPLLAALAFGLCKRRGAAIVAAGLSAVHPLLIYYSQEVRMYTMLVTLCVLCGYALYKAQQAGVDGDSGLQRWWIVYVFAATAAVYTHYFAFFVLFTFAILYLTQLIGVRKSRSGSPATFFYAHFAILLLYSPWLVALLTRLAVDTSYWQGEFKWWEALRHVAITFVGGETTLEPNAMPWLYIDGAITLLVIVTLLARRQWRLLFYGLCWLLLPLFCVLALASINPKFNARYAMIALPGLLLLWSGGLGDWRFGIGDWRILKISQSLNLLISFLLLFVLLVPFRQALNNWFFTTDFTKAQWRELAVYVKQHIQPNEKVVLVSGHAWPIWHQYAPELPVIRLPNIEILDVNSVLDYETVASAFREQLGDAQGVWVVYWQNDVVDPNNMVPLALELHAQEEPFEAQFWQLHLKHYVDLDHSDTAWDLPAPMPHGDNFGHLITLRSNETLPNNDLLLVWQRDPDSPQLPEDLWITGEVRNQAQVVLKRISERRPASYVYPTGRWRPGEIVIGRIPAADLLDPGALPNLYELYLTVFDPKGDLSGLDVYDTDGTPLGKQSYLIYQPHEAQPGPADPSALTWPQLLPGVLLQPTLAKDSIAAGEHLVVDMHWYLTQTVTGENFYWLRLINQESGKLLAAQPFSTAHLSKVTKDRLNQVLSETVSINADVVPGVATLQLSADGEGRTLLTQLPLTVLSPTHSGSAPLLADVFGIGFMASPQAIDQKDPIVLALSGVTKLIPEQVKPESMIDLSLVWQQGELLQFYGQLKVTLQLLDESGTLVSQVDQAIPTDLSSVGDYATQELQLKAPAKLGSYRLIAAVYDASAPRLPRLWTSKTEDYAELGTIQVGQ
ncbi:MAG: glycosyltransferase family 39 protein [Caldilineaceae bacterium]